MNLPCKPCSFRTLYDPFQSDFHLPVHIANHHCHSIFHPQGSHQYTRLLCFRLSLVNMDEHDDDPDCAGSEDDEQQRDGAAKPISAKKQLRRNIFNDYVAKRARNVTDDELQRAARSDDEERISIRDLLAREEGRKITEPREYQLELFERAKDRNVIAVLDTGSGKTHISVLLLRHVLEAELEHRAKGRAPKVAFFLVDSVALVMQQHSVLSENLAYKVEPLCGALNVDLWNKATWDEHLKANMAFVCTAEVLHQCLYHLIVRIDQVSLLIFDEAHHAKKEHPYAKIIRDYYLKEADPLRRPKIFGMTASPVDANVDDVREAAMRLETMLQAEIATTSNIALLQNFVHRPKEEVAQYRLNPTGTETSLHQEMVARYGNVAVLNSVFEKSKHATKELGTWCGDSVWRHALAEAEARKKERRVERAYNDRRKFPATDVQDEQVTKLREAEAFLETHQIGVPQLQEPILSDKVIVLCKYLQRFFGRPSDTRCIVFVERRYTARMLFQLFSCLESRPSHLKAGMLTGIGSSDDVSVTFRQQLLDLQKFRKGDINCMFATSVAEEGLDIPACNLVIRFDLYRTMLQYVQSRGRARHANSTYLHMLEQGNHEQQYQLRSVFQAEQVMRRFCEALPEDRKLNGNDDGGINERIESSSLDDADSATGAGLTGAASLAVLAHFVSTLPTEEERALSPMYNVLPDKGQFICEVVLPEASPVPSMTGATCPRKSLAKQSAALRMCVTLKEFGHLDQNWLPAYTKKLPAFRNAQLAVSEKKRGKYHMRTKPDLWTMGRGKPTAALYLTVLTVSEDLDRPHCPIGLLTREPLLQIPRFPIFLSTGEQTEVLIASVAVPLTVDEKVVNQLNTYTLRAFKDIWNKTYENDPLKMSWWLAPLKKPLVNEAATIATSEANELIDWESVAAVNEHEEHLWDSTMTEDWLRDRFLVDRWDGGRRFFVKCIVPNLRSSDPVPSDAVKLDKFSDTILNYTVRLWKRSREGKIWNCDQPVLLADQMLLRQDLLSPPADKEKSLRTKVYICPEPLKISALKSQHVAMLQVFPPVIHRIEQYLIALEAFALIGVEVSPALALEAMTKDNDGAEDEEGDEAVTVHSGMGANYERLEFIGDCFLKMATTLPLYARNISTREEDFHIERMLMLCNQNLRNTAIKLELFQYVRSQPFSRRTWYPEGLMLLDGRGHKRTGEALCTHALGDKTVADVCEAAIGAAFMQHNKQGTWKPEDWDAAVKAVTVMVNNETQTEHTMLRWSDYFASYEMPEVYKGACPESWLYMAREVEKAHDYHFKHPRLLRSAFTHGSMGLLSEGVPTYQRLEFLGDSLLDMACVSYIFYKYPTKDPQWLTEHKTAMVANRFLGALCVRLGLHKFLKHSGSSAIEQDITRYVQDVRELEAEAGGRPDYWTEGKEAPKCLPDILEAYVGAVFVDSGFDYGEVQRFFDVHIQPYFEDMSVYDTFARKHPMTQLQNRLEIDLGCRDFRLMGQAIEPLPGLQVKYIAGVMIHDQVVVDDVGKSGRYSKARACIKTLKLLEGLAHHDFVTRFRCDCKTEVDGDTSMERDIGSAI